MVGLDPKILLRAYAVGLFPMAESFDDPTLYWIDPEKRGIIPLNKFHIPRRLRKSVRRAVYDIRCDFAFEEVIRRCASPAPGRQETWINKEIINLYTKLYTIGQAHSVEAWLDNKLVGGLYGVTLGGAFFGESMFSDARDASKISLVHLVARLNAGGFKLLDTQFVTKHLSQFGVIEMHRSGYRQLLTSALEITANFLPDLSNDKLELFIQSTTQTS